MSLGRFRVGITGLKAAIEEVKLLKGAGEEEIAQALLEGLRSKNYIPASAQEEYKQAFLRNPRRPWGKRWRKPGPGEYQNPRAWLRACAQMEQTVMAVLEELGAPAEVEHVRDSPGDCEVGGLCHSGAHDQRRD